MKVLIAILTACILSSCTVEYSCHSYGNTNLTTNHGQKAQSKYAKHNKHKSIF